MKNKDTTTGYTKGELMITQEDVVGVMKTIIATEGLRRAIEVFQLECYLYGSKPGWDATIAEVQGIFAEERRKEQLQEWELKKEMALLGAVPATQNYNSCQVFTGPITESTFNPNSLQPYE